MANHRQQVRDLRSELPTFVPLSEAVRRYNLTEDVLTRLIRDGRIEAAQLPSGELLVSDDDLGETKTKEQITEEKFGNYQPQSSRSRSNLR
jgi:hypothetical protein